MRRDADRPQARDEQLALGALVAALVCALAIPWLLPVDRGLSDWLRGYERHTLKAAAFWLQQALWGVLAAILLAPVSTGAWRRPRPVVSLAAVLAVVAAANELMKTAIERLRPRDSLLMETGNSFPSGHIMNTTAAAVALCLLARQLGWPLWARRAAYVIAVVCVLCQAAARLLRGSHWLSDVAPSILLGFALTIGALWLAPRLKWRGVLLALLAYCGAYLVFKWVPAARLHLPSGHEVLQPPAAEPYATAAGFDGLIPAAISNSSASVSSQPMQASVIDTP